MDEGSKVKTTGGDVDIGVAAEIRVGICEGNVDGGIAVGNPLGNNEGVVDEGMAVGNPVGIAEGVVVEGIAAQQHDISIKDTHAALLQLETDLDSFITHEELIAINADEPTTMYFSHRKGWLVKNEELQQASFVKDLKTRGLKAIVILKKAFGTPVNLPYEQVFDNEHYAIYLLSGS